MLTATSGLAQVREHYDGETRDLLRGPEAGEKVLVVYAREFEPEGDDCDARLLCEAYFKGWKQFIIPFKDMKVSRKPVSLACVERITFAATGWNLTFNPNLVLHLTDLKPIKVVQ